jgi:predicted unusual protein kinase regulating ubiquinone biosynthesis (AarF/ABC1/UbiB family)
MHVQLTLIEKELGPDKLEDIFESLSDFDKPVAAASLGQVYKAHLKGTGVAGTFINIFDENFFLT